MKHGHSGLFIESVKWMSFTTVLDDKQISNSPEDKRSCGHACIVNYSPMRGGRNYAFLEEFSSMKVFYLAYENNLRSLWNRDLLFELKNAYF
ncbi:hypothetical protein CEXT_728171 [Caerostris extrusa]|uniref:Uncharacterized protein n=1 Tax=Caerostris extrusa TaxID=172846 RepID=A0AAV4P7Z4_CAEEX|nr:hypothetical protein CEXT_728171 [Caerostris extrusa]